MSQFVHLHVHTQYSILDGASSIKGIVARAKALGMPALAITDHGNMFGVKDFHDAATKEGIKPILGCEVYVVKDRFVKDKDEKAGDHLVLLAKNLEGYHNLIRIVSYSWTEGYYYKPRIDKSLLRQYGKGIICCSACLGGEIPQAIMKGKLERASEVIEEFKDIFGDDYYLEMQLHRSGIAKIDANVYENQVRVNKEILRLAEQHNVKYIASNDVHFIMEEDAEAHDRLICLNTGRDLDDPTRMRYTFQEFLKSSDQMAELFKDKPEALATTLEIADKIEEYSLAHKPLMPNFPIPEDFEMELSDLKETFLKKIEDEQIKAEIEQSEDLHNITEKYPELEEKLTIAKQNLYLKYLTLKGAHIRYGDELSDKVTQRINYELSVVEWMGFPGYFLIVWDFIRASREMGVSVGPGRGSAAGSVVAYCLWITNIDPLKYDLLFERFLNPDRISLPDVDVDFDDDGRAETLRYVIEKYGQKRVAQIITFGTMAPKMAIRDVARVQKLSLQESDRLAKLVPEKPGTSFAKAYKEVPELEKEKQSTNFLIRDTLKYAEKLEGSIRQTGVHACGVIIGQDDLELFAPMAVAKDADLNVVQFEGKQVESVGLIKMDFLGLKTLSIIKEAIENIVLTKGEKIDIDSISLEDVATYELYARGETTGLFQFESPGMKKHLRNLVPNRFEDLIAMNALYRPGPMEYIPNFIARKHGREPVTYDLEGMDEYLGDTYGITVYQEQVMLLSQKLAGFTGGEADTLRKAMGKKQKAVLDKLKPKFLTGAVERGHDEKVCEKVWTDWEAFASYAFNKSHSTCYAYISYQTAYLKAHFPSEFMAALLSRNLSDIKKISLFMDEAKRMAIPVLGPDVNKSIHRFAADKMGNIRFGLSAIKGVGEAAVSSLIKTREDGEFKDIYDFFERVNLQQVNKKTIENLALSGAFDSLIDFHRSKFFIIEGAEGTPSLLEQLTRYGSRLQAEAQNSQQSLFGGGITEVNIPKPLPMVVGQWSDLEMLGKERELIGIYLSAHPLDNYSLVINNFCNTKLPALENINDMANREFSCAGMVTSTQHLTTKTGKPFGRFTMEDYSGSYTFVLFDKDYENMRQYMYDNYFLFVRGRVSPKRWNDKEFEVKIHSIIQLSEAEKTLIKQISLTLPIDAINKPMIDQLGLIIKGAKGDIPFKVLVYDPETKVSLSLCSKTHKIGIDNDFFSFCVDNDFKYTLT